MVPKRKLGRPRKDSVAVEHNQASKASPVEIPTPVSRGRGRPRKSDDPRSSWLQRRTQMPHGRLAPTSNSAQTHARSNLAPADTSGSRIRRGRGRPPKKRRGTPKSKGETLDKHPEAFTDSGRKNVPFWHRAAAEPDFKFSTEVVVERPTAATASTFNLIDGDCELPTDTASDSGSLRGRRVTPKILTCKQAQD